MGSFDLSPLQRDLLEAFCAREEGFFLTGGAALVGFYLHHRETLDLAFFSTVAENLEDPSRSLRNASAALGATVRALQQTPDFRRFTVQRGNETTLVDLVIDRAPQAHALKQRFGLVHVDPMAEIAANKLSTLLSRSAPRDLIDLTRLLESGLELEEVLRDAQKKDSSAEPATLAWVLSELHIGPDAPIPAGTSAEELDSFRRELVARFARMAFPDR